MWPESPQALYSPTDCLKLDSHSSEDFLEQMRLQGVYPYLLPVAVLKHENRVLLMTPEA